MKQLGDGGESNSDFWAGLIGAVHHLSFLESVYPQKHLPRSYQVPEGIQYILPAHLNEGILVQGVRVSGVGHKSRVCDRGGLSGDVWSGKGSRAGSVQ